MYSKDKKKQSRVHGANNSWLADGRLESVMGAVKARFCNHGSAQYDALIDRLRLRARGKTKTRQSGTTCTKT